ncbi:hypothetical protein, partial [Thiomonas sp. SCN 64-16]|uniref:hypothetical protein n=1 Tax=Thiomonas sp. SCN 64-16 TaxID=1660151 RepID=UPI0025807A2C
MKQPAVKKLARLLQTKNPLSQRRTAGFSDFLGLLKTEYWRRRSLSCLRSTPFRIVVFSVYFQCFTAFHCFAPFLKVDDSSVDFDDNFVDSRTRRRQGWPRGSLPRK